MELVQWGRLADRLGRAPTPREYADAHETSEIDAARRLASFKDAVGMSPIAFQHLVDEVETAKGLVLDEVRLVLEAA